MPVWPITGNGNAKQANWQKNVGTNATMNQAPTLYNMQRQLNGFNATMSKLETFMKGDMRAPGKHNGQGKGQGKGADPGKGKGKGKDKGKSKSGAWASYKAFSADGTQVLVTDHNRAYFPAQQTKLDAEIAKLSKAAAPQPKAVPTQVLRRELLEVQPVMQVDSTPEAKEAADTARTEQHNKMLQLMGLAQLPSSTIMDVLYPVPRAMGPRKSAVTMATEKLEGSNSGNLEDALQFLDGCKASVGLHKNCNNAQVKEGLLKEQ